MEQVTRELPGRAVRASHELRKASREVLRGQRSGRVYRKPSGGTYRASAPGEPPALRTGTLRRSWRPIQSGEHGLDAAIESSVPYADYMENGTPGGKIAPRPFAERIIEKARPKIEAIYDEPFDLNL